MRGLTKCERQFKRALKECPDLVDTALIVVKNGIKVVHDTTYIRLIVDKVADAEDSMINANLDSFRVNKTDTFVITKKIHLSPQERKFLEDKIREDVIANLPPPKIIKDTIVVPFKDGFIRLWQISDSLDYTITYKKADYHNPCPETGYGLRWWEWLLIGFAGGFIIALLVIFRVKKS